MGFNSFHNSTQNPAQNYYRWSGGMKDVELPDGTTAKKLKGELQYWDGENNQKVDLPFQFCALEQTRSITGFSPTPGQNVRFFSNECVDYDDEMIVYRKDDGGTTEICRGQYGAIKEKLPQGARLQINLYIYNAKSGQIERLNLSGSALGAFIDFSKKNKGMYEHSIIMEEGEAKKTGSVEFMPPKFKLGPAYSDDEMKVLHEKDQEVVAYMKDKQAHNGKAADGGIDQTPAQYQGEENQETGEQEETIDLSEVPF